MVRPVSVTCLTSVVPDLGGGKEERRRRDKSKGSQPESPRKVSPPRHEAKAWARWPQKFLHCCPSSVYKDITQQMSAEATEPTPLLQD